MDKARCSWRPPEDWTEWAEWLAAGLHARHRWRLPILLLGMLFARGRRTVSTWLRAVGVSDDYQDDYYLLAAVGRKASFIATRLVILLLRSLANQVGDGPAQYTIESSTPVNHQRRADGDFSRNGRMAMRRLGRGGQETVRGRWTRQVRNRTRDGA